MIRERTGAGRAARFLLGGIVLALALGAGVGVWRAQRRAAAAHGVFDEAVEAALDLATFFLAWGGAAATLLVDRVLRDPERRFAGAAFLAVGAIDFLHVASGGLATALDLPLPESFGEASWGVSRLVLGVLLLMAAARPAWLRAGRAGGVAMGGGVVAAALGLLLLILAADVERLGIGNLRGPRLLDFLALGPFAVAAPLAAATGRSRAGVDGALLPLGLLLGTACQCVMLASARPHDTPYVVAHVLRLLSYGVYAGGLYGEALGRIALQVRQARELDEANAGLAGALGRLREAEGRYRDLFERAPVHYVRLDPDGRVAQMNPPAAAAFGVDPASCVGTPFESLLLEGGDFAAAFRDILSLGSGTVDVRWRQPHGGVREGTLHAQVERDPAGRVAGLRGALLDRTEALRLERQLALEAQLVRRAAHEAILVLDAAARVIRANEAAGRLLGRAHGALTGASLPDLAPEGTTAAVRALVAQTLSQGGWRGEISLLGPHGRPVACAVTTGRILVPGSQEVAIGLFAHDISDRRAMEDSLREANRRLQEMDARKNDFLATVSHELRTPLTGIQGHAMNLLAGAAGAVAAPQREILERIVASAQRLGRLIRDLLDLDAVESGHARWEAAAVPVGRWVGDAIESLRGAAERAGVRLEAEVATGLPSVRGDADRLAQVLQNLLGNAIGYTPAGGRVMVRAARDADGGVHVTVLDQGPGIPRADRERIFEKYVRLAHAGPARPGAGLGLAIARGIVLRHGGRIWADEASGGGAAFHVVVPAAPGDGGAGG